MFSVATLPLNSPVYQSRYVFFMPLFAFAYTVSYAYTVLSRFYSTHPWRKKSLLPESEDLLVTGLTCQLTQLSRTRGSPSHCWSYMQLPPTVTLPRGKTFLPSLTPFIRVTLFTPFLTMDIWYNVLLHLAPFQSCYLSAILPSNVEGISGTC